MATECRTAVYTIFTQVSYLDITVFINLQIILLKAGTKHSSFKCQEHPPVDCV